MQDRALTVHRLCADRVLSLYIYNMSFPLEIHSETVYDLHIQDCVPTVHLLRADRIMSLQIRIVPFSLELHSKTNLIHTYLVVFLPCSDRVAMHCFESDFSRSPSDTHTHKTIAARRCLWTVHGPTKVRLFSSTTRSSMEVFPNVSQSGMKL
jgi:hypothetical protein